jgi:hypothetical protein
LLELTVVQAFLLILLLLSVLSNPFFWLLRGVFLDFTCRRFLLFLVAQS